MRRLTVSIPDRLAIALDKILEEHPAYRKKSHVVADALEGFIRLRYPTMIELEEKTYPTVLWRMGLGRERPRGPSLRAPGRKAPGEWKVVELP